MSIKDLFNSKPSIMASPNSASAQIESPDYVEALVKNRETYIPPIDFSKPESFIRFGLATEYYEESIKRIYTSYPYDGSEKEKQNFILESSYLDRWMLEKKYPKYSGYADFRYDSHVVINRGYKGATRPNYSSLNNLFQNKNTNYETDKRRKHTLIFDLSDGITIEWWMKKNGWNNPQETFLELTSSDFKLDILLSDSSSPIQLSASSGEVIEAINLGASSLLSSSVADNLWHHYALSIINNGNSTNTETYFYVDGVLNNSITNHNVLSSKDGLITGYLGSGSFGLLSASVNEFRVWNKKQKSDSIYYNYNRNIGGGSSTDKYRNQLSVYYKFNEGSTLTSSIDRIVLDYSGRISNGYFENYTATNRQTGSSFASEQSDPIVRSNNPLVVALQSEMLLSGSNHDRNNNLKMYDLVYSWIREEDEDGNQQLKNLTQIMASYFDTLYSQIEYLPDLRAKRYFQSTEKPLPFANKLLEEKGIIIPEVLINKNVLEYFGNRDSDNKKYEKDFEEVKNLIYYNIYNNLEFILKSKGTEKSYRNFLRCFGIDDEIVKLNVYTDYATQYLVDKVKHTSVKTKTIDFFTKDTLAATVYQENSVSGSLDLKLERNSAITAEVSTFIPKRLTQQDINFFPINFLTASIFGVDSTTANGLEYSQEGRFDSFEVVLAKTLNNPYSTDAKWMLRLRNHASGTVEAILTSSVFQDIYENNEFWTVAVKIYPESYPFAGSFVQTYQGNYKIDFYGVTHAFDGVKDSFSLSTTVSNATGSNLLSSRKRAFVGARRTNWSGSVVNYGETKINSFRLYYDKLEDSTINQHNKDPFNYGQTKVFGNPTVFNYSIDNMRVPGAQSLAINWDFQTVTGSDSAGSFNVEDFSSGSSLGRYGWLENVVAQEHRGVGYGFPASSTSVYNNEYVFASKKELPEISFTADNIQIMGKVQELLAEDEDVTDNLFAIEKSMYQVVSEEMMNMFSTISEYSNLFIKPVDRYRTEYKRLNHIRQLFFERVSGSMDLETFTSYYKWIDGAVSHFLNQLHPAMSKFSPGISDMVESHILERPKYTHKFGFVRAKGQEEGVVKGVNELTYNWQFGHSPEYKSGGDNDHCLWQKERKQPSAERVKIQSAIITHTTGNVPEYGDNNSEPYAGSAYALKRFSKPYSFGGQEQKTIHGGINYERTKDRDLLKTVTQVHGPKSNIGIPTDVVVLGVGEGLGIETVDSCQDVEGSPTRKRKYGTGAIIGRFSNFDGSSPISGSGLKSITAEYNYRLKGQRIFPFNLMSGSEPTGYNKKINDSYTNNAILTNLHSDTTSPTNDIPMQGPFTQTWVGGRQSRHIPLNRGTDNQYNRPEEYRILIGDHPDESVKDGALGMTGPDYGGPYPDTTRQWAIHYRDERAKRPVNLANRKRTSQVEGNYAENYEIVSVVGRKENNLKFREFESTTNYLPSDIKNILPETTHPMTLIGITTDQAGNVFGQGETTNINATREIIIPGTFASGSFQITGATLYKAPYSASFEIQPIPVPAKHQSYYFQSVGKTHVTTTLTASFTAQPVPVADKHSFVSFKVNGVGSLSDGDELETTIGTTVVAQVDTDGALSGTPDIFIDTYRRAVQHTDLATYTQGTDNSFIGISTSDFTVSFWLNNVTATSIAGVNQIYFYDGGSTRHEIIFDNDISVRYENTAGTYDAATFNTNIQGSSGWNHYVITFSVNNLSTGVPKLWKNGVEISGTGYSAIGGTTPDIDRVNLYLDEQYAIQDLVFWNIVFDQTDVNELYNSGIWFNPSTHTHRSNIIGWYPFGEEPEHRNIKPGDTLLSDGSDTEYFYPVYHPAGHATNAFTFDITRDEHTKFIKGFGNKTNTEVWDNLKTDLESFYTGSSVTYIAGATQAQFFIRNNNYGPNGVSISGSGASFDNLVYGEGSNAVSSTLTDGDTLTIDGSTFTVRQATSGSAANDLNVGQEFRKALRFANIGSNIENNAYNESYSNPTSDYLAVSFWMKLNDLDYDDERIFEFDNGSNNNCYLTPGYDHLYFIVYDGTTPSSNYYRWRLQNFYDSGSIGVWKHYTLTWDRRDPESNRPSIWVNGVEQTFASAAPHGGTRSWSTAVPITKVYIGDDDSSGQKQQNRGLQDFCIWNTQLSQDDARILYNSGSWFDPHGHASASYIWDWWLLGEESNIGQSVGDTLSTGTPVTSISPIIGRHDLTLSTNANVFVTDGIAENTNNTDWWSNIEDKLSNLLAINYEIDRTNGDFSIHKIESGSFDSLMYSETGDTFTTPSFGSFLTYVSGASHGDTIEIEGQVFSVDATGSNSGATYADSGGTVYVNSTTDNYWTNLQNALLAYTTGFTVSYSDNGSSADFFLRKEEYGSTGATTFLETGTTFSELYVVTGANPVSSSLQDQATLSIAGSTITIGHTTSGSTTINTGLTYRKALAWPSTGTINVTLYNTSFVFPDDPDTVTISFWFNKYNDNDAVFVNISDFTSTARCIDIMWATSILRVRIDNQTLTTNTPFAISGVTLNQWHHVTLTVPKDLTVNPSMWIDGVAQSLEGGYSHSGTLNEVDRIYIGDYAGSSTFELEGAMQDVVVWNNELNQDDVRILYNSGSWFDIHSHPSASYIWDWWMLGEESNIGQSVGDALSTGTPVTTIAPTVGRHTLTVASNGDVSVSQGIHETPKTNLDFWNEVTESLLQDTPIDQINSFTSGDQYQFTASTSTLFGDEGDFVVTETGNAFSIINPFVRGPDDTTQQRFANAGANDGDYLQIDTTRFIIDIDGGTSGTSPGYQKSGDHWYIYSSGATHNIFWDRLYKAIDTEFPLYSIYTSSVDSNMHFFEITSSVTGTVQNRILTEFGNSYFSVHGVTGATNAVFESGYINVTQIEPDFITGSTRQKTIIASRFSAPGGPEVQTYGFLDAYAHEYSVHNAITYRNLSVRGDSGEAGTIRVNSPASRREGLNTLQARHCGKFGIDSTHGSVSSVDYSAEASFHKIHRNGLINPSSFKKCFKIQNTSTNLVGTTANISDYPTSGGFSNSFWVKFEDLDNPSHYRFIWNREAGGRLFYQESTNRLELEMDKPSASNGSWYWTVNLKSSWHHIVITWDGNFANKPSLYIDEKLQPEPSIDSATTGTSYQMNGITTFFDYWDSDDQGELGGLIMEMAFFNIALTQAQVSQVYNGRQIYNLVGTDLGNYTLGYWKLDSDANPGYTIAPTIGTIPMTVLGGISLETSEVVHKIKNNNFYVQTNLPQSDYNYSWVDSTLGDNYSVRSGTQKVFGYWPKNGINKVNGVFDSAITFPTASEIQGS